MLNLVFSSSGWEGDGFLSSFLLFVDKNSCLGEVVPCVEGI